MCALIRAPLHALNCHPLHSTRGGRRGSTAYCAHMNVQAVHLGVVAFGNYVYFVYLQSLWNLISPVIVHDSLGILNCYG